MQIKNGLVTSIDGVKIIRDLIPITNTNARPGINMIPEYITIHNTGGKGTSSAANSNYVDNQNGYVSWHFTVGANEVYQEMPITEHAWHAGDGSNGDGNKKSIGVEIAEVDGAEETAINFIAQLLIALNMDTDKVVPHQHWSGKYCPRVILPHWDTFIKNVENEMELIVVAKVKRYKNISEMPEWMQTYVKKWVNVGYIKGNTNGELDFSKDMVRVLIIAERMIDQA